MKERARPTIEIDILLTALVPVIWGSTYLVTTELLPPDRPLTAAAIRSFPVGILLVILTRCFVPSISWIRLLILSAVNIAAFQALLFIAAYRLPGGLAAIAGAFQPLMVLGLAWVVDKQQSRIATVATGCIGIFGMGILFSSPEARWDPVGVAAAFGGTTCMALGTFLSRRWKSDMDLIGFTGWQLALGGGMLMPFAFFLEPSLPDLSAYHWIGYLYLSLVGTLLAYSLWFRGIDRLSPAAVSSLGLLSPVTAAFLGWFFLGETMKPSALFGMGIVLLSVLAMQWQLLPATDRKPMRVFRPTRESRMPAENFSQH